MLDVSVVIPTFNSQPFLKRSLSSVLAQTNLPKEVVVVDDGSTDNTVEELNKFKSEFKNLGIRFSIISNQHLGPGATRNTGIFHAKEEWIAFLDSDDCWEPTKLEECSKAMREDINTITHWEEYKRLDGSSSLLRHAQYDLKKDLSLQVYRQNRLSTSAMICKRELLNQVGGFDPTLPVSQDYDLWLRLSPHMRLAVIEKPLGYYFEHGQSITARPYWKRYGPFVKLLIKNRHLGSTPAMLYLIARATLSRQWATSFINFVLSRNRH